MSESLKFIRQKLICEQWSPEEISQKLVSNGFAKVSTETVYRHIYQDQRNGGDLHRHLRHKVKSYKRRSLVNDKRGHIKGRVCIEQRPSVVDEKKRLGDWEMDLIIGNPSGAVLVTMVEPHSFEPHGWFTFIAKAPETTAALVSGAILESLIAVRSKVLTLTYDNGKEFARHAVVDRILGSQSYFAHPYSSWERGLNESTNGLIRQYFPKKSSFDDLTEHDSRTSTLKPRVIQLGKV